MNISRERLQAEAQSTGFRPEILEKVFQLLNLLEGFTRHPFLKGRLALKGGTALNLFLFDLPRLSVDIDLNYIGGLERDKMLEERPNVEKAVQAVCSREGMTVERIPGDHAGGKWRLRYGSALGGGANLAIDLNYVYRIPLWPVRNRDSRQVGSYGAQAIPLLDIHELAAGKMAALLSRHAGRDLFDVHRLLTTSDIDDEKLRLGFVVFGAMNRKDWRTVTAEDVGFEPREIESQLLPVLRSGMYSGFGSVLEWSAKMVQECREQLARVLPLSEVEGEFLDKLLDHGEVEPSLLTSDARMAKVIETHPGIRWKVQNVRQHKSK